MKVGVYQLPVELCYGPDAIEALRVAVRESETAGVALLCFPEATLGGLADYVDDPRAIALGVHDGTLAQTLAPLASPTVTYVVGFTEVDDAGRWFNSAAVYSRGRLAGVYRKRHPAIRRSCYAAGTETLVFDVDGLRLGIMICRDSTDKTLAAALVSRGAQLLVVPTNNAMPSDRGGASLVADTRAIDLEYATSLGVPVARADVVGSVRGLWSAGSSAITASGGTRVWTPADGASGLLVGDVVA